MRLSNTVFQGAPAGRQARHGDAVAVHLSCVPSEGHRLLEGCRPRGVGPGVAVALAVWDAHHRCLLLCLVLRSRRPALLQPPARDEGHARGGRLINTRILSLSCVWCPVLCPFPPATGSGYAYRVRIRLRYDIDERR